MLGRKSHARRQAPTTGGYTSRRQGGPPLQQDSRQTFGRARTCAAHHNVRGSLFQKTATARPRDLIEHCTMCKHNDCHAEPFGFAQDRLREAPAFFILEDSRFFWRSLSWVKSKGPQNDMKTVSGISAKLNDQKKRASEEAPDF